MLVFQQGFELPAEELANLLDRLPYPALLTDDRGIVTFKNVFCKKAALGIRKGSRIRLFLSWRDTNRILNLPKGGATHTDINVFGLCGATVYHGENYYFFGLCPTTAMLMSRTTDKEQAEELLSKCIKARFVEIKKDTENNTEQKKSDRFYRFQRHIAMLTRFMNGDVESTEGMIFSVDGLLGLIIDYIRKELGMRGFCVLYQNNAERDFCARGDGGGFLAVTASIFGFCSAASRGGAVCVKSSSDRETFKVSFICDGGENISMLGGHADDSSIDMLLVKMICEHNGWEYSVSAIGTTGSFLEFTLILPRGSGCILLSDTDYSEALKNELSVLNER